MTQQVSELIIESLGKRVLNLEQQVAALKTSNKRLREERHQWQRERKQAEANTCSEEPTPKAFVVDLSDLLRL